MYRIGDKVAITLTDDIGTIKRTEMFEDELEYYVWIDMLVKDEDTDEIYEGIYAVVTGDMIQAIC